MSLKSRSVVGEDIPNRIHIIGSVGSGKTTLARELSLKWRMPFYELDNVVWKRYKSGDVRRTDEEIDAELRKIICLDAWIIEGVHHKSWVIQCFQNADVIIFLDTTFSKRRNRIIKRFLLQKLGLEKANYKPTVAIFRKMFEWNARFEKESKAEIFDILVDFQHKLIICRDNSEVERYLQRLFS